MKPLPASLAGRTIAILLIGLAAFHGTGLWLYNAGFRAEIDYTNERQLAERIVGIKRVIPPAERPGRRMPTVRVSPALPSPASSMRTGERTSVAGLPG